MIGSASEKLKLLIGTIPSIKGLNGFSSWLLGLHGGMPGASDLFPFHNTSRRPPPENNDNPDSGNDEDFEGGEPNKDHNEEAEEQKKQRQWAEYRWKQRRGSSPPNPSWDRTQGVSSVRDGRRHDASDNAVKAKGLSLSGWVEKKIGLSIPSLENCVAILTGWVDDLRVGCGGVAGEGVGDLVVKDLETATIDNSQEPEDIALLGQGKHAAPSITQNTPLPHTTPTTDITKNPLDDHHHWCGGAESLEEFDSGDDAMLGDVKHSHLPTPPPPRTSNTPQMGSMKQAEPTDSSTIVAGTKCGDDAERFPNRTTPPTTPTPTPSTNLPHPFKADVESFTEFDSVDDAMFGDIKPSHLPTPPPPPTSNTPQMGYMKQAEPTASSTTVAGIKCGDDAERFPNRTTPPTTPTPTATNLPHPFKDGVESLTEFDSDDDAMFGDVKPSHLPAPPPPPTSNTPQMGSMKQAEPTASSTIVAGTKCGDDAEMFPNRTTPTATPTPTATINLPHPFKDGVESLTEFDSGDDAMFGDIKHSHLPTPPPPPTSNTPGAGSAKTTAETGYLTAAVKRVV
ncbi:hypothetical protein HDU67_010366, partial [Dinochytrium kinnereticum]